jgi:hypothetical protein
VYDDCTKRRLLDDTPRGTKVATAAAPPVAPVSPVHTALKGAPALLLPVLSVSAT